MAGAMIPVLPPCCRETLERDGASCVFGCGSAILEDGMCRNCRDHSANAFECDCGLRWERWGEEWERVK